MLRNSDAVHGGFVAIVGSIYERGVEEAVPWLIAMVCVVVVDLFAGVALAGFCGGLAAGIGKEYGDECAEGNQWDWQDIFADAIGSLVGAGFAMILTILI